MKVIAHFTYPLEMKDSLDGREVKHHWDLLIKRLRYEFPNLKYAWVLEFTVDNRMPHFHALFNQHVPKEKISLAWYEVVGSGLGKHLNAGTRIEAIRVKDSVASYLIKYLDKKNEQKDVPEWFKNVGRFWGYSRGLVEKETLVLEARSRDFESVCELKRLMRPLIRWYRAKNREWSKKRKKPYKWRHRGAGFIAWGGNAFLEQNKTFSVNLPSGDSNFQQFPPGLMENLEIFFKSGFSFERFEP